MTPLRRYLAFHLFALWQGGFLLYAAVVVPAGTEVLGGAAAQGVITTRVSDTLNLIGVAALAMAAWDVAMGRDPNDRRATARWACWSVMMACLYVEFVCHELLDSFMDPARTRVVIRPPFRTVHVIYLWAATLQWVAGLGFAWWTLRAWAGGAEGRASRAA